jgi:hypothetical protein
MAWGRVDRAGWRRETIERQLAAMHAERYVVGVHQRATERMWRLTNFTAAQVLDQERQLAGLNVRGRDIYIAPVGNSGLILLDDVPSSTLDRLRADELAPALVVETSPENFQAWIRVAPEALPKDLATAVSRELAVRYDGDRGSVGAEHLGRLAGYTNQKPSRTLPDGRQPWVRLQQADGQQARGAEALLTEVRARLESARSTRSSSTPGEARDWKLLAGQQAPTDTRLRLEGLAQEFASRVANVLERQRERLGRVDYSAADWAVVGALHTRYPQAAPAELAQAMRLGSPYLEERHPGHVADYVGRTVTKALREAAARHARDAPAPRESTGRQDAAPGR